MYHASVRVSARCLCSPEVSDCKMEILALVSMLSHLCTHHVSVTSAALTRSTESGN